MALQTPQFLHQFFDDDGAPAASFKLYAFESGTTTPKTTYQDQAEGATNTHPIVLDASGRCNLWLDDGAYTFRLDTAADDPVWTRDDVSGLAEAEVGSYLPLAGGTLTGDLILTGNATTGLEAVPKQQLDSAIATAVASLTTNITAAVPIGTIALWLTTTAPSGWLHLNGQAVSRSTYSALFALWGTTFGSGDGSTTFNVPETRGEFPRFWDASRGVDAGRAIGTAQEQAIEAHVHDGVLQESAAGQARITLNRDLDEDSTYAVGDNRGSETDSTGGAETRPRNFSFMAIVKAA